jgi:transposase
MTARRAYPSDISDARWELIGPTLLAWQQARIDRRPIGEPARTDLREVFNALRYLNRTGVSLRYLPHDFPPHGNSVRPSWLSSTSRSRGSRSLRCWPGTLAPIRRHRVLM